MNTNAHQASETSTATVISIILVSVMVCIFTYFMARQATTAGFQTHGQQIALPAPARQPAQ